MKLFMESNNKIKFTLIVGTVILTVLTIFHFCRPLPTHTLRNYIR